jgi:hypothetical protein
MAGYVERPSPGRGGSASPPATRATDEEFLFAIAEVMREEYRAIVAPSRL